jgi:hypothetical protein
MNATVVTDLAPPGEQLAGMQRASAKAPAHAKVFKKRGRPFGSKNKPKAKAAAKKTVQRKRRAATRKAAAEIREAVERTEHIGGILESTAWRYMVGSDGALLLRHEDTGDIELPPSDAFALACFLRTCAFAFARLEEGQPLTTPPKAPRK